MKAKQSLRRRIAALRVAGGDPSLIERLEERQAKRRELTDAHEPDFEWLSRFGTKGAHGSRKRAKLLLQRRRHIAAQNRTLAKKMGVTVEQIEEARAELARRSTRSPSNEG